MLVILELLFFLIQQKLHKGESMAIEFDIKESKKLKGVYIITPNKFQDLRGEIWTSYSREFLKALLPNDLEFVLDKFTLSKPNVLRGIHGDVKTYKLVTCITGEIYQVVVDCRKDSPTYLQWEKFIISSDNQKLILIPPCFGNAQYVSSKCDFSASRIWKCTLCEKQKRSLLL